MSNSYGDKSLATMRTLVATVEHELAANPPPEALRGAWDALVKELALGPAPELRTCPTCGEQGMRAASRCIRCWSALTPA